MESHRIIKETNSHSAKSVQTDRQTDRRTELNTYILMHIRFVPIQDLVNRVVLSSISTFLCVLHFEN